MKKMLLGVSAALLICCACVLGGFYASDYGFVISVFSLDGNSSAINIK